MLIKKLNRYIQIRLKSVKLLMGKTIILNFLKSEKNVADPLTKGHSRNVILDTSKDMGLSLQMRSLTIGTQPS